MNNILIKNNNIHIAHGLNPSMNPKITATNGNDTLLLSTLPNIGKLIDELCSKSAYSFILFSISEAVTSENPV